MGVAHLQSRAQILHLVGENKTKRWGALAKKQCFPNGGLPGGSRARGVPKGWGGNQCMPLKPSISANATMRVQVKSCTPDARIKLNGGWATQAWFGLCGNPKPPKSRSPPVQKAFWHNL